MALILLFLTETKLNGCHTSHAFEYDIFATKLEGRNQGGIALVFQKDRNWHIESVSRFGSNIIKCTLVHDNKRTILVGIYIPPLEEDLTTIRLLDRAL